MLRFAPIVALFSFSMSAACIDVNGGNLLARDLAKADPAFEVLDPHLVFSWAPALGEQRVVTRSELQAWASQHGLEHLNISSACFERSAQELDHSEVTAVIKDALGSGLEHLQIDISEVCQCKAPKGKLEFSLAGASRPITAQPDTPVLWRGRVVDSDGAIYPVWVRVRIQALLPVVRAASDVRQQHVLTPEDLQLTKIESSPLVYSATARIEDYAGKVTKVSLSRGAILKPELVRPRYEIERGSVVAVEVVNGGAQLALRARAETAGNAGETVILTNPAGSARFRALVTGPGHAEVLVPAFEQDPWIASTRNSVQESPIAGARSF